MGEEIMTIKQKISVGILFVLIICLGLLFLYTVFYNAKPVSIAVAASYYESESNDTMATANRIYTDNSVHGSISSYRDVDWYQFYVYGNGYFNISFSHSTNGYSSSYWTIYLYDSNNNPIAGLTDGISVPGNLSTLTTSNFGVPSGTYYIKITSGSYSSSYDYSMIVNYTHSGSWEREDNSSKNTADNIALYQTINGSISSSRDVDWYKINIQSSEEVAIRFDHEVLSSSSTYWEYYVYNSSSSSSIFHMGRRGDTATAISDYIKLSGGIYYIKVQAGSYYSGVNYSFCVMTKHEHIGEWTYTVSPTCTESGIEQRECEICSYVEIREAEAFGHSSYKGKVDKKSTTAHTRVTVYTCEVCGDQYIEKFDWWWIWVVVAFWAALGIIGFGFLIKIMVDGDYD